MKYTVLFAMLLAFFSCKTKAPQKNSSTYASAFSFGPWKSVHFGSSPGPVLLDSSSSDGNLTQGFLDSLLQCDTAFRWFPPVVTSWMNIPMDFLLSLFSPGPAQQNLTYVQIGYECLIIWPEEKVVGARWVDWQDGSEPGFYWLVESNYNPPPNYYEIAKWFFAGRQDSVLHGWHVKLNQLFSVGGECAYGQYELVETKIDKSFRSYFDEYRDTISISSCDEFNFTIK